MKFKLKYPFPVSLSAIFVALYIASFSFPINLRIDIPLLGLSIISIFIAVASYRKKTIVNLRFLILLLLFLAATGVSIAFSTNIIQSLRTSTALLPAAFVFVIIAEHFKGIEDTRLLFFTFSFLILVLSIMLLSSAWNNSDNGPFEWVKHVGSPLLIVKNDVTFFSVAAPLSLALIYHKPRSIYGFTAILSIVLSLVVVGTFQSRTAMLTMAASFMFFFTLVSLRIGIAFGAIIIFLILVFDGYTGFQLVERFIKHWDGSGRIPLWLNAWEMFLDAPLSGQGPHTFAAFYDSYLQNLDLPSWISVDKRTIPWAHNLYFEFLAEQGIIGLTTFGLLLTNGLLVGIKFKKAVSNDFRIYGYGAFAGLASFCAAALVELTFLRHWVVLIFFTLLGTIAHLSYIHNCSGTKVQSDRVTR